MSKRDYYEALEVSRTVTPDELKAAYRKQAIKFHPDKNQGNKQAEEKFKEVNEAYSVLSDPEKRKLYDQFGHAGVSSSSGGPGGFSGGTGGFDFGNLGDIFGDIFEDAFGRGGRSKQPGRGQGGRDLRVDREVTLKEVLSGVDVSLDVPKLQPCETCHGSGAKAGTTAKQCPQCHGSGQVRYSQGFFTMAQTCGRCRGQGEIIENPCGTCHGTGRIQRTQKIKVRIPPGVEDGTTLRIAGSGEAGERGGPPGDLYVVVHVTKDKNLERDGANLLADLTITFPLASLGGNVDVPSLDGNVRLKIPPGTQPGVHFRVSGHGLPHLKNRSRGDLYVRIQVSVPKKLTKEEKKLIQELGEKMGEKRISEDESVFKKVFGS